jgi:hypothetical protein
MGNQGERFIGIRFIGRKQDCLVDYRHPGFELEGQIDCVSAAMLSSCEAPLNGETAQE